MEKKKIRHKIKQEDFGGVVYDVHEHNINMYSREIFLHSYHYTELLGGEDEYEPGMDYRMASIFIKNLSLLNNQVDGNILIHQQSCGGCWNYGMSIYNAILASPSPITILAYAHARSMSSITLQAAKLRVLMPDCDVIIHHGNLAFADRATPIVSNVKYWEEHEKPRMLEIYASRCRKGKYFKNKKTGKEGIIRFIANKMKDETDWIMPAEEGVYYGFADGILGTKGFETIEKIRE